MDVILYRRFNKLVTRSEGVTQIIWNVAGLDCEQYSQCKILSTERHINRKHIQIGNIFGDVNIKEKW